MAGKIERDHWHPGFLGAMELEFIDYKDELVFDGEHQLSKEPLKMDLLIIKKKKDAVIANQIGAIFRQYNIFEFKSPRDSLTIDDYIKTVGYAYLYKGLGKSVNEIPHSELTVTLVRDILPEGLFKSIAAEGGAIREIYPGIYHISGIVGIPTQFVLTSRLDKKHHTTLRLLTENAKEEDIENFLFLTNKFIDLSDRRNADALLSVSVPANREAFENVRRRNPAMSDGLREFMKDIIEEENQKAIDTTLIAVVKNLMKKYGWDANTAMESMGIPASDQIRYAARL